MEELRWDLTELYPGPDSPELEADLQKAEELAEDFETTFRGKINDPGLSADLLARALIVSEEILEIREKLHAYAFLLHSLDTQDPVASALLAKVQEADVSINNRCLFFELEWKKLPEEQAVALLNNPALHHWRHALEKERLLIPYTLSEPEERILNELSPIIAAWGKHFEKIIGGITVQGKPLSQVLSECSQNPDRGIRWKAYHTITRALKREAPYIVDVLNATFLSHKTNVRLRSYEGSMAPRNLDNEISKATVEALLSTCDELAETVAQYYRLKRRLLRYPRLYVYDRYAPLPLAEGEISFSEAREIVITSYTNFSAEMGKIVARAFEEGWLDTPVIKGKRGGAFAYPIPFLHPFILLNWTGRQMDVLTEAHELGHGLHQDFYAQAGISLLQMDPPMILAETASVFGERLVLARLMAETKNPAERLALLCHFLDDVFATSVRQAAITRFEQKLHETRAKGELSIEQINASWLETQRAMFKGSVNIPESYGWWWVYISHLLRPFYCYSYSFGQLLVLALYGQYLEEGEAFVPGYLDLLSAGGSDSPANLLKKVGVDIEDPNFWKKGAEILGEMVEEAEELARYLGY